MAKRAHARNSRPRVFAGSRRTDWPTLARLWRADEAGVVGGDDELGAVARPELHEQAADVSLRGRQADMQVGSDLCVGQAESDQGQDFALPLGYLVDRDRRALLRFGVPASSVSASGNRDR